MVKNKHFLQIAICTFAAGLALLTGCNNKEPRLITKAERPFKASSEAIEKASWNQVLEQVIIPQCINCHGSSGGVSLESYQDAQKWADAIESSVFVKKSMPPKRPLTESQKEILAAWLLAGQPLNPAKPTPPIPEPPVAPTPTPEATPLPGPTPTPDPAPTPIETPTPTPGPAEELQPTYESIYKLIISPKCIECHNSLFGDADPMETKEELFLNNRVIKGDPTNSEFIKRVSPGARKLMPPPRSKIPPLTVQEIDIISRWIQEGAL